MKHLLIAIVALHMVWACQNQQKPVQNKDQNVELTELTLRVTGMTCGGCENSVVKALMKLDGVADATASFQNEEVIVHYDPARVNPEEITNAIHEVGYTVVEQPYIEPEVENNQ